MSTTENRAAANLAVVSGIYEAFGRGEIGFILDQIAGDCAWESWLDNYGQKAGLPPMQPRHGRAGVAEFFHYVATMQIQDFQVPNISPAIARSSWRFRSRSRCPAEAASPTRSCISTRSMTRARSTACAITLTRPSRSRPINWRSRACRSLYRRETPAAPQFVDKRHTRRIARRLACRRWFWADGAQSPDSRSPALAHRSNVTAPRSPVPGRLPDPVSVPP